MYGQIAKMLAQDSGTRLQLRLRNHKNQNTTRFQPPIRVFQKNQFQALIIRLSHLKVIGRIQIKKRD